MVESRRSPDIDDILNLAMVAKAWGALLVLFGLVLLISGFYVGWALLSKGGRARYRQLVEAMAHMEQHPRGLAARLYRRR